MNFIDFSEVLANLAGIAKSEFEAGLKKTADGEELKSKEEVADYLDSLFGDKFKEIGQTNLKRGKREALSSLEKDLKKEFEIDSKLQGIELVNAIVSTKKGTVNVPSDGGLTEENAKDNPIVQKLLKAQFDINDALKAEYEDYKNSISSKEHTRKVHAVIRKEFLALNPVLPSDESKKERAIERFIHSFDANGFKITEEKEIIPVDANGEPRKDKRFNSLSIRDIVSQENYFDLHKQDPTKSSPSPITQGSKGKLNADVPVFSSEDELNTYINTVGDYGKAQAALQKHRETQAAD